MLDVGSFALLIITSTGQIGGQVFPSKTALERVWKTFLESGSTHSSECHLLPHIMNRCEREKVDYLLKAMPGVGYFIEPICK